MSAPASVYIAAASASRRSQIWLGVCTLAVSAAWITSSALWRRTVIDLERRKPQYVELTPYGHAEIVSFDGISETMLDRVVRRDLSNFAHAFFGRKEGTINRDFTLAWSMLGEQQRRQRQHQFTDDVAAFKANPSNEIEVKVAAVTILSTESLKTARPHHAVIDFEKATVANGLVTKRELWVATLDFTVGADVESDLASDNPLGLTITALREEPVL